MCPRLSFWSFFPDLPDQFGVILLALAFGVLLSPYIAGADFGPINIPNFAPTMKRRLKLIGPFAFVGTLVLFLPIFSPATLKPTHTVKTSAGLINLRVVPLTRGELDAATRESLRTGIPHDTIMTPLYNGTPVQLIQRVDDMWFLVRVQKDCELLGGVVATRWTGKPTIHPLADR